MKLRTLAVAIVAATVSVSAQADVKLSGDMTATYNTESTQLTTGANLNIYSSAESNGLTYYGGAQIELSDRAFNDDATDLTTGDSSPSIKTDDIYVGVKGGFGDLVLGDRGNACDSQVPGGFPDQIDNINQGGCVNASRNNIMYTKGFGAATVAVSHNPNDATGSDHSAIGVSGKFGAVSAGLGYVTKVNGAGDDALALGLTAGFGNVTVGTRIDDNDQWGVWGKLASGANTFALGTGENAAGDSQSVAYWARDLGASATFITEVVDPEGGDTYANIRLKKAF